MPNATNNNSSFNAPATGIIQKSTLKSFFLRFHEKSSLSEIIFADEATYKKKPVEVLQVMLTNEGYVLAELIFITDQPHQQ